MNSNVEGTALNSLVHRASWGQYVFGWIPLCDRGQVVRPGEAKKTDKPVNCLRCAAILLVRFELPVEGSVGEHGGPWPP